eukprot:CAMPEP_0172454430 /NCGR_PEP_ID=MMETSP1065-20121228/11421_1 /TAXON_ID=265537 /ORGANISM="Amphiprora paludosa, Strain CCMP125" /LENGTH=267 /DNA_ID=CAMNT_0013206757 /DNA_START=36 /DNA_END=839 /DNA_ORIENTATION=+
MAKAATQEGSPDLFSQVANEILTSAEQLSDRLEEGLSILWGNQAPEDAAKQQQQVPPAMPPTMDMKEEIKEMLRQQGEQDMDNIDWSQFDMDADSPLNGIAENVMGNIMQGQSGPQTFQDHLDAFRTAITWSEPFILSLLAFQLFMFLATIYVSRKGVALAPRIVIMALIAGVVRGAEYLNTWAGQNWQDYCTQNYFDQRGVFTSIFVCAPLLVDSFIMLIMFLRESSVLLVQVKTAELKQKRKAQKNASGETNKGGNPKRRGKKDQ